MQIPRIHDNGTPAHTLIERYEAVAACLEDAFDLLKQAAPNPRDYEDIEAATAEHMSRLQRIDDVKTELSRLVMAIDDYPVK